MSSHVGTEPPLLGYKLKLWGLSVRFVVFVAINLRQNWIDELYKKVMGKVQLFIQVILNHLSLILSLMIPNDMIERYMNL